MLEAEAVPLWEALLVGLVVLVVAVQVQYQERLLAVLALNMLATVLHLLVVVAAVRHIQMVDVAATAAQAS
jgi:hypothetical protein